MENRRTGGILRFHGLKPVLIIEEQEQGTFPPVSAPSEQEGRIAVLSTSSEPPCAYRSGLGFLCVCAR